MLPSPSRLLCLFAVVTCAAALQCYNGMKLVRGQSVGESTTECDAYCYNMTSSVAFVVDVVKAGCSRWRCMLARDKCISTTFNLIPVSLCCCSSDRCNVGENAIGYDPNWNNNNNNNGGGGFGGNNNNNGGNWGNNNNGGNWGNNDGNGGNWGNNNNNNGNNGGWGNNNNNNNDQQKSSSWGGLFAEPGAKKETASSSQSSPGKKWTKEEVEKSFNMEIDHKPEGNTGSGGGGGTVDIEETFEKVDANTTPRPRRHAN